MLMVGSSTVRLGNGSTVAGSHRVSETLGSGDSRERHDIAGARRLDLDPSQAMEAQDLGDFFGALLALAR